MRTRMSDKDPAKCLALVAAAQTTMAQQPAWRIYAASRASEEGSFFARERQEWREAALISSAPRFSSSPTGLSFFLIQLYFIQIPMRIQSPFVSLRESGYRGWDMQTKRINRCIFPDRCISDGKSTTLLLSVVDYKCSSASNPLGKNPSPATVRDVQCETCPFPDIQDEFRWSIITKAGPAVGQKPETEIGG